MEDIKVGDVVRLNSNHQPLMTVKYMAKELATCIWFDGNTLREENFRIETKQKAKLKDKPRSASSW